MRRSKFSEEQISMALRQAEAGTPVTDIFRKLEITETTFYRWKKKYGGLGVPEPRELKQLREENRKLKQLVADLSLNKTIRQESLKKKVRRAERRAWVAWVQEAYRVSERRACRATGVARFTVICRSRRLSQEPLRRRLRELAGTRVSYGYKRLHILLCREGWMINHKRVYRLYGEEGLALKRRRPKRRKSAATRVARPATTAANERWAMDFVHDTLAGGGTIRVLGVLDVHTRECVALVGARCFRGDDVARVLCQAGDGRGLPDTIQ